MDHTPKNVLPFENFGTNLIEMIINSNFVVINVYAMKMKIVLLHTGPFVRATHKIPPTVINKLWNILLLTVHAGLHSQAGTG